jgi:hypothetical protein
MIALVAASLITLTQTTATPPIAFHIEPAARTALHQLWQASLADRAERVACIGGAIDGDTVRITRILALSGGRGDSLGVSARASLDSCGPPVWQGTVHTHIAMREGQRPYASFSGSDRGVMLMWWQRWKMTGIFCVLYSADAAHCELDGVEGGLIFPPTTY